MFASRIGLSLRILSILGNRTAIPDLWRLDRWIPSNPSSKTSSGLTVRTGPNPDRRDEVMVEVRDTGHGIPAADLPKIFEPFYTTKPQGRGTGLGLSICYGIVSDLRGRIEVESQVGVGTDFKVYLPV
mgnify:CR=1 FL=1